MSQQGDISDQIILALDGQNLESVQEIQANRVEPVSEERQHNQ